MAGIHLEKTLHVHANREVLFAFWANPENYARVFSQVKEVRGGEGGVYRWHIAGPAGIPLGWTGRITRQPAGRRVEWRSLPGSLVENHGVIRLDDEGDGDTRVHAEMEYAPPAGLLGHGLATLLGTDPRILMHHDLVQLQSVLERGVTTAHRHRVPSEPGLANPPEGERLRPGARRCLSARDFPILGRKIGWREAARRSYGTDLKR